MSRQDHKAAIGTCQIKRRQSPNDLTSPISKKSITPTSQGARNQKPDHATIAMLIARFDSPTRWLLARATTHPAMADERVISTIGVCRAPNHLYGAVTQIKTSVAA